MHLEGCSLAEPTVCPSRGEGGVYLVSPTALWSIFLNMSEPLASRKARVRQSLPGLQAHSTGHGRFFNTFLSASGDGCKVDVEQPGLRTLLQVLLGRSLAPIIGTPAWCRFRFSVFFPFFSLFAFRLLQFITLFQFFSFSENKEREDTVRETPFCETPKK